MSRLKSVLPKAKGNAEMNDEMMVKTTPISVARRYEKAYKAFHKAKDTADRIRQDLLASVLEVKTEAELDKVEGIARGLWNFMPSDFADAVKSRRYALVKPVRFKGYEIKKVKDYCPFKVLKDGKQEGAKDTLEEAKAYIEFLIEAEKKAMPLMKKLGIDQCKYEKRAMKRSMVYSRTTHWLKDEFGETLMKFAKSSKTPPERWKVRVLHDCQSPSDSELRYEMARESEFVVAVGDSVEISDGEYRCSWGID